MRKLEFSVTQRELDTIVPALLMWQFELVHTQRNHQNLYEKASKHGEPLSDNEVRLLVERINCDGINAEEVSCGPKVEELVKDPSTPYWAVNVIREAATKDLADAANTLEVISRAFSARYRSLLAQGGR